MAEGVSGGGPGVPGGGERAADPVVDAVEHLAAAIGTDAWDAARAEAGSLLPGDGGAGAARVQEWAAEALRLDGAELDDHLIEAVPRWQEELAAALADDPERAEQARRFTDTVRSLLMPADATGSTGTQIATATGHGTVNAVQNGNIYYQVVFGQTPRPRKMSRGAAGAVTAVAGTGAAAGGTMAARHFAAEAADKAGAGVLPEGPLADPAGPAAGAASGTASGTTSGTVGTGASTSGAVAGKGGASLFAKAVSAVGVGGGGVSVPVVATVVSVVVVTVVSVSVVVTRTHDKASCDAAVNGRSAPVMLAEAARRTGLTSYRFDVSRGRHHVTGAADPRSRSAWFTQQVGEGPVVSGTISGGKVALPAGTTVPDGADARLVRSDGAFNDAVDPTAVARLLRSVARAEREGCRFTGTLSRSTDRAVRPVRQAAYDRPRATSTPAPASSAPTGDAASTFSARIDEDGRLVRLEAAPGPSTGGHAVSARYTDFGLRVTPSVPPPDEPSPSSGSGDDAAKRLNGDWRGEWDAVVASGPFTADLTVDSDSITGELTVEGTPCDLSGPVTGTIKGDRITFGTVDSARAISFTGTVDDTGMRGTFTTECQNASGQWSAQRTP
ncbi:hypothetical protein [Streptomyces sp. NPDC059063]|uniref:hypothetical protein n=1 Tax=unclassified Streptomyces TaxID=2593676 RepID=UPI0036BB81E0